MRLAFHDGVPYVPIGMGTVPSDPGSIAAVAAQGAATTGGILAGLSALGALSPAFALAGPIGAAIAGLTAVGIAIANMFQGCGQVCVDTANLANQAEPILANNLMHYFSAPIHYQSLQLAALNNFDTIWAAFSRAELAYGQQGQISITARQAGACRYHVSPFGWSANTPGMVPPPIYVSPDQLWAYSTAGANQYTTDPSAPPPNDGTVCWNWFKGYRDPIATDPSVVPDPVGSSASFNAAGQEVVTQNPVSTFLGSGGAGTGISKPLLLAALAIGAALLIGGD